MSRENRTESTPAAIAALARDLRNLVAFHKEMGVEGYHLTPALLHFLHPATAKGGHSGAGISAQNTPARTKPAASAPAADSATLADIHDETKNCTRCRRHQQRRAVVFGEGTAGARLFIVGDFPTPAEDRAGAPFQGEAGELLDKMLGAITLNRTEVYLANMLKCYSPEDQPPAREEIEACLPLLLRQIAAIKPTIICAMGETTAQALLRTPKNLLQLRGKWHELHKLPLMATFHPAFLLRNPEMKRAAWIDLQLIQKRLAATPPPR